MTARALRSLLAAALLAAAPAWADVQVGARGAYEVDRAPPAALLGAASCEYEAGDCPGHAWANQESATLTVTDGVALLDTVDLDATAASGPNIRYAAAPSAVDFAVTAKVFVEVPQANSYPSGGLWLLSGGTIGTPTQHYVFSLYQNTGAPYRPRLGFASIAGAYTTVGSAIGSEYVFSAFGWNEVRARWWWLQWRYVASTKALSAWFSLTGAPGSFVQVGSAATLAAHPQYLGWYGDSSYNLGSGPAPKIGCDYIRVRTDAAGLAGEVGWRRYEGDAR